MSEFFILLTCFPLLACQGPSTNHASKHHTDAMRQNSSRASSFHTNHPRTSNKLTQASEEPTTPFEVAADENRSEASPEDDRLYYDQDYDSLVVLGGSSTDKIRYKIARGSGAGRINDRDAWVLRELQRAMDSASASLGETSHFEEEEEEEEERKPSLPDVYRGRHVENGMERSYFLRVRPSKVVVSRREDRTERNVFVHLSDDVTVPCIERKLSAKEVTWAEFNWYDNAHQLMSQNEEKMFSRISITDSQELWVKEARRGDSGVYVCSVELKIEGKHRHNILNVINVLVYTVADVGYSFSRSFSTLRRSDGCHSKFTGGGLAEEADASFCRSKVRDCEYTFEVKCDPAAPNRVHFSELFIPSLRYKTHVCSDSCLLFHKGVEASWTRLAIRDFFRRTNWSQFLTPYGKTIEKLIFHCRPGYFLYKFVCIPCSPGTYYRPGRIGCEECPEDTHQPAVASLECIKCPEGLHTKARLSRSSPHCLLSIREDESTSIAVFVALGLAVFLVVVVSFVKYVIPQLREFYEDRSKITFGSLTHNDAEEISKLFGKGEDPFQVRPLYKGRALKMKSEFRSHKAKEAALQSKTSKNSLSSFFRQKIDNQNVSNNNDQDRPRRDSRRHILDESTSETEGIPKCFRKIGRNVLKTRRTRAALTTADANLIKQFPDFTPKEGTDSDSKFMDKLRALKMRLLEAFKSCTDNQSVDLSSRSFYSWTDSRANSLATVDYNFPEDDLESIYSPNQYSPNPSAWPKKTGPRTHDAAPTGAPRTRSYRSAAHQDRPHQAEANGKVAPQNESLQNKSVQHKFPRIKTIKDDSHTGGLPQTEALKGVSSASSDPTEAVLDHWATHPTGQMSPINSYISNISDDPHLKRTVSSQHDGLSDITDDRKVKLTLARGRTMAMVAEPVEPKPKDENGGKIFSSVKKFFRRGSKYLTGLLSSFRRKKHFDDTSKTTFTESDMLISESPSPIHLQSASYFLGKPAIDALLERQQRRSSTTNNSNRSGQRRRIGRRDAERPREKTERRTRGRRGKRKGSRGSHEEREKIHWNLDD